MPDVPRKEESIENIKPQSTASMFKLDLENISATHSVNAEIKVNEVPKIKIDTGLDRYTSR
mgnify:CR=1 FL=1